MGGDGRPPFVLGLADGTLPDGALQAWVQQDRIFVVEERRVAALRAHGLPSRLDGLLADLDRSLVLEADAFTQTATDQGFALEVEPWPVRVGLYLLSSLRRLRRRPGGPYRPVRGRARLPGHLDGRGRSQPGRLGLPRLDPELERGGVPSFRRCLGRGLDELAGTPSPALTGRLGVIFTGAARFELAFWEMCWSGQAWPG